jgi:hypothetical protein
MISTWERRWFVLDDAKLYYVSEQDQDEGHKIHVSEHTVICVDVSIVWVLVVHHNCFLFYFAQVVCELVLANVRELKAYEIPFCFEIAFANFRTTLVQAEGPKEYAMWIHALRSGIEKSLVSGVASNSTRKVNAEGKSTVDAMQSPNLHASKPGPSQTGVLTSSDVQANKAKMKEHVDKILAANQTCAECSKPDPDWVSLNLGCVVCIDCSGVHRSLGVHISKMRSLTLDDLEPAEYAMLMSMGNELCNSIWEAKFSPQIAPKPVPSDPYAVRDKFIRAKYQHKRFLAALADIPSKLPSGKAIDFDYSSSDIKLPSVKLSSLCLLQSVARNDLQGLIKSLAWGGDASGAIFPDEENPLVVAICKGFVEVAMTLILNGAPLLQSANSDGAVTPLSVALLHSSAATNKNEQDGSNIARVDAICAYVVKKGDKPILEPIPEALWQSEGADDLAIPRTAASMGNLSPPRTSAAALTASKTKALAAADHDDINIGTKAFRRQSRNTEHEGFGALSSSPPRSGEDLTTSFEALGREASRGNQPPSDHPSQGRIEPFSQTGAHDMMESAQHVSQIIHDKGAFVVHQVLDALHEGISAEEMMANASSARSKISQTMKGALHSTESLFPATRQSVHSHSERHDLESNKPTGADGDAE